MNKKILTALFIGISSTLTPAQADTAIFAGGCFWCTESDFEKLKGVNSAVSGYIGGTTTNPTYKEVTYGLTGHYEAVEVDYDPAQVSYSELVEYYWTTIDPYDFHGQFCDKGASYRSAIFTQGDEQFEIATESKKNMQARLGDDKKIATVILRDKVFYDAEEYHQDYYKRNSARYNYYRWRCGRDDRLEEVWGKKK